MKKAHIQLTPQVLRDLLLLPQELSGSVVVFDPLADALVLVVEGPHLEDVPDDQAPPVIQPIYERDNRRLVLRRIDGYKGPVGQNGYREFRTRR